MAEPRVIKVTEQMDFRFYCDPCGELGEWPNVVAADARARRHAAKHPDHYVSASHIAQTSYFTRPASQTPSVTSPSSSDGVS